MKKSLIWLPALALAFLTFQCAQEAPKSDGKPEKEESASELVERGEYLVTISGCEDCHSPKKMTDRGPIPDPELRLSGHPAKLPIPAITDKSMTAPGNWVLFNSMTTVAVGPWGITYSANLTPDPTGIGEWSFAQFKKALTEGKAKGLDGGRMMLPPMPWPNYVNMKEEDMKAIFAYLKSLPPVSNLVPAPVPAPI